MKKFLSLLIALALVLSLGTVAFAADYPTKGIQVICPWAAGGGTDACLRAFADALGRQLGVTLTVDNQTGGGGILGHQAIADADPDGYTLGMITFELATYNALGQSELTDLSYDPLCRVNTDAAAITVNAEWAEANGITDLATFIDYCKEHPGEVQMGGSSNASVWHIAGGYLMNETGIEIQMITYQEGAATAVQNAAGGFIQGVTVSLAEARSFIESGHLICLGVMDAERNPSFPDVPTCAGQVVNGQGHTQLAAQSVAEGTEAGVGAAAGSPGADDGDALGGIVGSKGNGAQAEDHRKRDQQRDEFLHGVSPSFQKIVVLTAIYTAKFV